MSLNKLTGHVMSTSILLFIDRLVFELRFSVLAKTSVINTIILIMLGCDYDQCNKNKKQHCGQPGNIQKVYKALTSGKSYS